MDGHHRAAVRVLSTKCTSTRYGLYGTYAYALRVMRVLST